MEVLPALPRSVIAVFMLPLSLRAKRQEGQTKMSSLLVKNRPHAVRPTRKSNPLFCKS